MARILVVDDKKDIRDALKRKLEFHGYEVTLANDGVEAIEAFRKNPADMVITDIFMPRKTGIDALIELKKDYPDIKVIVISAVEGTYHEVAKEFGALKTFTIPFDWKDLMDAIKKYL